MDTNIYHNKTINSFRGVDQTKINLLDIFNRLLKRWYIFLITGLIFMSLAYVNIKRTPKVYLFSAKMMISDSDSKNSLAPGEYMSSGIQMFNSTQNLDNELEVIRSFDMIREVVDKLDFDISYFWVDFWGETESYNDPSFPFSVKMNEDHFQIIGQPFNIQIESTDSYHIEMEGNDFWIYNTKTEEFNKVSSEFSFSETIKFGDTCSNAFFNFILEKSSLWDEAWVQKAVEEGQTYSFYINSLDAVADAYREKLKVERPGYQGTTITLITEGTNQSKEINFLNTLCETYIEQQLKEKNNFASKTIDFIDNQLSLVSDSLKTAEKMLLEIRESEKTLDIEDKSKSLASEKRILDLQKVELESNLAYYNALLTDLNNENNINSIVAPEAIGISNPILNSLVVELKDLYKQKTAKSVGLQDESLEIKILNNQIEEIRGALIQNIKSTIKLNQSTLQTLNSRIASIEGEISRLPGTEEDFVQIQRKFQFNDNLYSYLLQRRAEAGIAKAANSADSRMIEFARLASNTPIYPNKKVILATAFLLSLVLPGSVIIGLGLLNNKISDVDDFENNSKLPILGSIVHADKNFISNDKDLGEILSPNQMMSPLMESMKFLSTNILQYKRRLHLNGNGSSSYNGNSHINGEEKKGKVLGVTSTVKGEGKTFVSTFLSASFAQSGFKTVVLSADLRRRQLDIRFKTSETIGLSDYLYDKSTLSYIIQETEIPNLYVIPSGLTNSNYSMGIFYSAKLEELFDKLREEFDFIIVDSAPVGLISDYLSISRYIDMTLYIARFNYSKKSFISEAEKLVEVNNLENVFLVLNDVLYRSSTIYGGNNKSKYAKKYGYDLYVGSTDSSGKSGKKKKKRSVSKS